jgi:mono/diheme cytochrome c family protein
MMMKVYLIRFGSTIIVSINISCLFLITISGIALAQDIPTDEASLIKGEQLYLNSCHLCHDISKEIIGPALVNITEKRPTDWLLNFINNSQQMIVSNDSVASFLYEKYNHNVMPSFYRLTQEDVLNILGFIKKQSLKGDKLERKYNPKEGKGFILLKGKQLFDNQCSQCHAIGHQVIGPGLSSVPKTRTMSWLLSFIKNSQKVITSGEPHANFVYKKYNKYKMPSFDFLSDEDIKTILVYIRHESEAPTNVGGINGRSAFKEDKTRIRDAHPYKAHVVIQSNLSITPKIMFWIVTVLIIIIKIVVGIRIFKKLSSVE